ncbi:hypothetical protein [Vibrio sp. B181a]|uniref:hypothetical protein n=1 Tax=Vibrio sp. B181a TaxID=2835906 RepID=UPI002553421D|nr:hypothetical protein [Vibrio sp. B181a]MDK9774693.1 hypothetical protein [Vibrio sp. B181a]
MSKAIEETDIQQAHITDVKPSGVNEHVNMIIVEFGHDLNESDFDDQIHDMLTSSDCIASTVNSYAQ